MTDLTIQDFKEWAFNPVTIHFVNELINKRNDYLEKLGNNVYQGKIEIIQKEIGVCQALKATIEAIESYKEAENEK